MKISKTSPSPRSPEFLVFLRKAHSLTSTLCISYFAKYLKCSLTHCIEVVFLSVCLLLQSSPPSVLPWAQLFPFAPSSHTVVPVSWPPLLPDMDLALQTDSLCAGSISLTPSILEQPSPFLSGPGRLPAAFSHSLSSSLKSPASVPTTHSLPPSGTGLLQALPPKSAKVTHGSFSPWRSSGSLSRVPSTPRRQKKQALEAELTSRKRLLLFGLSSVFLFFCCFFFSSSPIPATYSQQHFCWFHVCPSRAYQVALEVKNPPANAGDVRGVGSIPESGRSPGGGHGSHSSTLAWSIAWTEETGGLYSS